MYIYINVAYPTKRSTLTLLFLGSIPAAGPFKHPISTTYIRRQRRTLSKPAHPPPPLRRRSTRLDFQPLRKRRWKRRKKGKAINNILFMPRYRNPGPPSEKSSTSTRAITGGADHAQEKVIFTFPPWLSPPFFFSSLVFAHAFVFARELTWWLVFFRVLSCFFPFFHGNVGTSTPG